MSQSDQQADPDEEQGSVSQRATSHDEQERLRNAYGGIEGVTEFHVVVEQEDRLRVVPSGGAIPSSPAIEAVYVTFIDGVEHRSYVVKLETDITAATSEREAPARQVHRLREKGSSEWDEPWAVEAALEEQPGGWVVPTELRFEGLAKPGDIGWVFKKRRRGRSKRFRRPSIGTQR